MKIFRKWKIGFEVGVTGVDFRLITCKDQYRYIDLMKCVDSVPGRKISPKSISFQSIFRKFEVLKKTLGNYQIENKGVVEYCGRPPAERIIPMQILYRIG